MSIPKAVIARNAQADELHKAAYHPAEADAEDRPTNSELLLDLGSTQPEPDDRAADADGGGAGAWEEPESESEQTPESEQAPEQARPDPRVAEMVERQQAVIAGLQHRVDLLERELQKVAQARMALAKPSLDLANVSLASDAEIDEYGEDLVRVTETLLKRLAGPLAEKVTASVGATIAPQVDEVATSVRADVARARAIAVWAQLRAAFPNADEINKDPAWLKWLENADPVSGVPRQKLLLDAFNQGDGSRCVAIMREFVSSTGRPTKQPLAAMAGPPVSGGGGPRKEQPVQRLTPQVIARTYEGFIQRRLRAGNDRAKLEAIDKEEATFARRVQAASAAGQIG